MKKKHVEKFVDGVDVKLLEGLVKLSLRPEIKCLYELIRLKKYDILRDEFSYPESEPVKNAIKKGFYKGMDQALTFIVSSIKKSADILDNLEENGKSS